MGQITRAFAESIVKSADDLKHFPLTCHEQKQLAVAWLERHASSPEAVYLCPFCWKKCPSGYVPSAWGCCGEVGHAVLTPICEGGQE